MTEIDPVEYGKYVIARAAREAVQAKCNEPGLKSRLMGSTFLASVINWKGECVC